MPPATGSEAHRSKEYPADLWGLGSNAYVKISEHAAKILAAIEDELL